MAIAELNVTHDEFIAITDGMDFKTPEGLSLKDASVPKGGRISLHWPTSLVRVTGQFVEFLRPDKASFFLVNARLVDWIVMHDS